VVSRRDIGEQYRGWQAIDSTPQEKSGKKYQLGPVPLQAVKNGIKDIPFDLEFVYAEVNADERLFVADGQGGYKLVRTVTDSIGKDMSTKAVGSNQRHDVTLDYKYPEGTPQERASHGNPSSVEGDELTFTFDVDKNAKLGDPIKTVFKVEPKNPTSTGTVSLQLAATLITYTGKQVKVLQSSNQVTFQVAPGKRSVIPFVLEPHTYTPHLKGTDGILFRAFVNVKETGQASIVQAHFDFLADDVAITLSNSHPKLGEEFVATIQFTNPLVIKLTNLVLTVEGNNLIKVHRYTFPSLDPKQTLTQTVPIQSYTKGKNNLIVQLDTAEVNDLGGSIAIEIN